MNQRIPPLKSCMLAVLFVILFTDICLPANPDEKEVKGYIENAQRFLKQKNSGGAIAEIEKAIAARPDNGYYYYYLGETCRKNNLPGKALAAYEKAISLDYMPGMAMQQKGKIFQSLRDFDKAISEYHRSIEWWTARKNDEKTYTEKEYFDSFIAHSYYLTGEIHFKRHEYEKGIAALELCVRHQKLYFAIISGRKDSYRIESAKKSMANTQRLLAGCLGRIGRHVSAVEYFQSALKINPDNVKDISIKAADLGHQALGRGEYDAAISYYRIAEQYAPGWNGEVDMRQYYRTYIEVTQHRKKLGKIKPEFIYNVLIIVIRSQDLDCTRDGRQFKGLKTLDDFQTAEIPFKQQYLRQVIESVSDGRMTLSFITVDDKTPYVYGGRQTRPSWVGGGEIIYNHDEWADTIIRCWPWGEGQGLGGTLAFHYIPLAVMTPWRGSADVHPEHSFGIWLHEFFHSLESPAKISPAHGHHHKNRHHFQDWKGPSGNALDYIRWQFSKIILERRLKDINYHDRYPSKKMTPENFTLLRNAYSLISIQDRQRAAELAHEADKLGKANPEKAVEFRVKALQLSPYHQGALRKLAHYYHHTIKNKEKALFYYTKLMATLPDHEGKELMNGYLKDFGAP